MHGTHGFFINLIQAKMDIIICYIYQMIGACTHRWMPGGGGCAFRSWKMLHLKVNWGDLAKTLKF